MAKVPEKTQLTTDNESASGSKRNYGQVNVEADDDDVTKKKKEAEDKEPIAKPATEAHDEPGGAPSESKPPDSDSKTDAAPLGKSGGKASSKAQSGKASSKAQSGKASSKAQSGKRAKGKKGRKSQRKLGRKKPLHSQKPRQPKDTGEGDSEKPKTEADPKVPPLKIAIPGGGSGGRNKQEEGGAGQRSSAKGRGSGTLPYVIPCTTTDAASDSSDGNSDDKKLSKCAKRVLRSRTTNDDKDKGVLPSPHTDRETRAHTLKTNKSQSHPLGPDDEDHAGRGETSAEPGPSVELHPKKRKIKKAKDSHSSESRSEPTQDSSVVRAVANSNPYQMRIEIRKQVEERHNSLFPVEPKPPKDFHKYLMNRRTYTLQGNVNRPAIEIPPDLPGEMVKEFIMQEEARAQLRTQHLVEKEKLVLTVEQEILRVHGRAERAVANQPLPYSVCTVLRDKDVCNLVTPEQQDKSNAQRSRCSGRQINSWLQEVDDKWENIKDVMLRRQNLEAETLHATQLMDWEWKLKEDGLCEYRASPKIDPLHVPLIHVSNFDLRA